MRKNPQTHQSLYKNAMAVNQRANANYWKVKKLGLLSVLANDRSAAFIYTSSDVDTELTK